MRIILFFLLLPLTVLAHLPDEVDCPLTALPNPPVRDFKAILQLFAATNKQVESAACKTKNPPSQDSMLAVIQKAESGPKENRTINNVELKDESPQMLKLFDRLTSKWKYRSTKETNQPDIQNLYNINPECTRVTCAMEKIWGPGLATKLSYLYLKYGLNGSELSYSYSARFKDDELNDVLITLADYPPAMMPITEENKKLSRSLDTKVMAGRDDLVVAANATMTLFTPWVESESPERQQTLFHELAHNLFGTLKPEQFQEWWDVTGFKKKDGKWVSFKENCNISEYSTENGSEDFAETVTAYRYNPRQFIIRGCLEKYAYMKKIFGGVEFFQEADCRDALKD